MVDKLKTIDELKKEIGYKTACKPCRGCGKCDEILKMALDEQRETQGMPRPCESCRI